MRETVRKYPIEHLNALLESIKQATSLNERQIAEILVYNPDYFSQLKSRGEAVSEKTIKKIESEFQDVLKNNLTHSTARPIFEVKSNNGTPSTDLVKTQAEIIKAQQETINNLTVLVGKLIGK